VKSNTICSKSNATAVTAAGIELKVVIDQFREQVQNLEVGRMAKKNLRQGTRSNAAA